LSNKAEYHIILEAFLKVMWAQNLFEGMDFSNPQPITIFADNQSYIKVAQNSILHRQIMPPGVRIHKK
jgi:lipopolysaccharide export system protein LptA